MALPEQLDATRFAQHGGFVQSIDAEDMVCFFLNVGDADAQVVLLPEADGTRRVIIIDAGEKGKIPALLDVLDDAGAIDLDPGPDAPAPIALLVATHPHHDHIAGVSELFETYPDKIAEFWEPGFIHPIRAYHDTMTEIEKNERLLYTQPTSGMQRWFANTGITVLAPSIELRNRYDTYGVEINDSSLVLRIEHPATRVTEVQGRRNYQPRSTTASVVFGADAQTLSWSYVLTDFPVLVSSNSKTAKDLKAAKGDWNLLRSAVLKVSHHASKRGVNLELIERIRPKLTIVSSSSTEDSHHGFPHDVAQGLIREAIKPIAGSGADDDRVDHELGIFYTGSKTTDDDDAGSIATVLRSNRKREQWRFFDSADDEVVLDHGAVWTEP